MTQSGLVTVVAMSMRLTLIKTKLLLNQLYRITNSRVIIAV